MSDATTHLLLPYILAAQAQKHVTHNEALRILDGLCPALGPRPGPDRAARPAPPMATATSSLRARPATGRGGI